ncbi:hypothetical protein XELAEV_18026350mg [Xenopus laevis]|uniref:Uncharacterized protein n=1 Tax=Xenopus laevis TaxID=8355 RepID=A0A974CTN3_XENLA|nr:hypothetical protein XELAEV_18026350mg [Xenopus laevis]
MPFKQVRSSRRKLNIESSNPCFISAYNRNMGASASIIHFFQVSPCSSSNVCLLPWDLRSIYEETGSCNISSIENKSLFNAHIKAQAK